MFVISRFDIAGIVLPSQVSTESRGTGWNGACKTKGVQLWAVSPWQRTLCVVTFP